MSDMYRNDPTWEDNLESALDNMFNVPEIEAALDLHHTVDTPKRVVKMYKEIFAGCWQKPEDALSTIFQSDANQMIHVKDMAFYSVCGHHLLPFFGTASFAYIPNGSIVGLSKIPRLLDMYARRPQVQEQLTAQVVEQFQAIVKPLGCGLVVRAYHMCCMSRGIKQPTSYTVTTDLRGNFLSDKSVKAEFLQEAQSNPIVWR